MTESYNVTLTLTSLTILIPAYNEEKRLPGTLERVAAWLPTKRLQFSEVLVVDDGSLDQTSAIAESFGMRSPCFRLLRNPGNRGKGYAIRNGMLSAKGDWILYTDADMSTPIEEVERLWEGASAQNASIAIGSRGLQRSLVTVHQSPFREYSGRFFNLVMRSLIGLPFIDTQCGFKLFEANTARIVFSRQILDGFSFDVEDLYIAKLCGLKTVEVPVRWANVEGSKVRMLQGIKSFADLLEIRRYGRQGRYQC